MYRIINYQYSEIIMILKYSLVSIISNFNHNCHQYLTEIEIEFVVTTKLTMGVIYKCSGILLT